MLQNIGKYFILAGVTISLAGLVLLLAGKYGWFWRLPGDIMIRKESFEFYFPVTTCIVISVVISLILYLLGKR